MIATRGSLATVKPVVTDTTFSDGRLAVTVTE
jgi:hypothetical protein